MSDIIHESVFKLFDMRFVFIFLVTRPSRLNNRYRNVSLDIIMVLRISTCNQIVSTNHQWHLKCLPVVLSFSFLFTFNLAFWPFKVFKHLKWHSLIFLRYYQVLILYDNQFYPYNTNNEMKNDSFDGLVIFQSGISFPIRITFNFYPTQNLYR